MKSFADALREDQRLVILRVLFEMPGSKSNSSNLYLALETYGHAVSRDVVKTHLQWLKEQDLVETEDVGSVVVATLTERGSDVSKGRTIVPGVKKPSA